VCVLNRAPVVRSARRAGAGGLQAEAVGRAATPAARTGQDLSRVYPAPGAQVGYSAILFYGYVGVVGLALFAALKWWFKAEVGLAQVWCTYGARWPGAECALNSRKMHTALLSACVFLSFFSDLVVEAVRGLPGLHVLGTWARAGTCSKHLGSKGRHAVAQALRPGRRLRTERLHPRVVRVRAAV